jgi:hypothetical protein
MKPIVTILVILLCANINAQKEKFFASKWRSDPASEIKLSSADYQSYGKGKFLYYLSNDNENIYLDIKATESIEQNKILQMGLTVWLDMDNKIRKEIGIRFPIGAKFSRAQNTISEDASINPNSPLGLANTIELIGFKDDEKKRFPSKNTNNIRGSVKYDNDGNLIYNLLIPVSKLPLRNDVSGKGSMPFTLGIEYGASPMMTRPGGSSEGGGRPSGSSGGGRSGGGGGGRGGSSGGGRSGGGGSGGNMGSMQPVEKPVIIWMKNVKLASNQ